EVGPGTWNLVSERGFDELGDQRADAAELGVAERVAGAGFGEELAFGILQTFGNDDSAMADAWHGLLHARKEPGFVKRHFREQDDVRRIVGALAGKACGRGDPAGM